MVSVCLNGPTVRLVTTNTGGLSVVSARYLVSSQTEKPITTLYPLQPLTLACERHWYLRFLAVQILVAQLQRDLKDMNQTTHRQHLCKYLAFFNT